MSGLENQIPEDLIAIDIRQAIHYLGEVTGEIISDEILSNIFRNFCIGK
jgi:tRNA modification GTPase